ncbi:MAG TPA: hypothetical protein VN281_14705 [Verrucomicrobiae bacterium]|jgi:hypothetical protein|nr:hypothetical protein [Verrucomicrobiae bacterium]
MIANPQQRELLRIAVLRVLDTNPSGKMFGRASIALLCNQYGFAPSLAEISAELHYLESAGLIKVRDKTISPEVQTWQITKAGMDFVAQQTAES